MRISDWSSDVCSSDLMTTDTFPKAAARQAEIGGKPVSLAGIAKGTGMIAPDMATMLSFVFTDARLPAGMLQVRLREARSGERSGGREWVRTVSFRWWADS